MTVSSEWMRHPSAWILQINEQSWDLDENDFRDIERHGRRSKGRSLCAFFLHAFHIHKHEPYLFRNRKAMKTVRTQCFISASSQAKRF